MTKFIALFAVCLAFVFTAIGCGAPDHDSPAPSATATPEPTSTPVASTPNCTQEVIVQTAGCSCLSSVTWDLVDSHGASYTDVANGQDVSQPVGTTVTGDIFGGPYSMTSTFFWANGTTSPGGANTGNDTCVPGDTNTFVFSCTGC